MKRIAVALVGAFLGVNAYAGFMYQSELTVSGYTGETALSGFPILVRISAAKIPGFDYTKCRADGLDLQFTSSDGQTVYPHEIEKWDPVGGESLVWVRLPELSGTDTKVLFRFGDKTCSTTASSHDVWSMADYRAVWHFGERAPDGTAVAVDSAKFDADNCLDAYPDAVALGALRQTTGMLSEDGPVGRARHCGWQQSYQSWFVVSNFQNIALGGTFTVSGWVHSDLAPNYWRVIGQMYSSAWANLGQNGWAVYGWDASSYRAYGAGSGSGAVLKSPNTKDEWVHFAVDFNGTTATCYTNGAWVSTATLSAAASNTDGSPLYIGSAAPTQDGRPTAANFRGAFDEFRIKKGDVTADWAAAEYATMVREDFVTASSVGPAQTDALYVTATREIGTVSPAYGFSAGLADGELVECRAPNSVELATGLRGKLLGWTLYDVAADGAETEVTSGPGGSYDYIHVAGTVRKLVWNYVSESDFFYESEVTVGGYAGSTPLENFPVLVRISSARIEGFAYSSCQADGKDIQFVTPDGLEVCPHEVEKWDPRGESLVWVKVPQLEGTDTKMLFRFGCATLTAAASGKDVWSGASGGFYGGVWHFAEEATAANAGSVMSVDSAKHLATVVMDAVPTNSLRASYAAAVTEMVSTSGVVGNGRCNATTVDNNYFRSGNYDSFGLGSSFTFSAWYRHMKMSGSYARLFGRCNVDWVPKDGGCGWGASLYNRSTLLNVTGDAEGTGGTGTIPSVIDDGEWIHLAVSFDGANVRIYTNGCLSASTVSKGGAADCGLDLCFGASFGKWNCYGAFDEARLLSLPASADWMKAEYDSVVSADFATCGPAHLLANDSFFITSSSEALGTVTPAYGTYGGALGEGTRIDCSAPTEDFVISDSVHAKICGWKLYEYDSEGAKPETPYDESETNALVYVHSSGHSRELEWQVVRLRPVVVDATRAAVFQINGEAAVSGTNWIREGSVKISVASAQGEPGSDYRFNGWSGDIAGTADPTKAEIELELVTSLSLTADFTSILHVSTTGSDEDGDGTRAHPFSTIQHAVDAALPRNEIQICGGVYEENVRVVGKEGLLINGSYADDWSRSLAGCRTVIKATAKTSDALTLTRSPSVRLDGLDVTGGRYGLYVQVRDGQAYSRLFVTNNASHGIFFYGDAGLKPGLPMTVVASVIAANGGCGVTDNQSSDWNIDSGYDCYNCTIANNGADGLWAQLKSVDLHNCVIAGNGGCGINKAMSQYAWYGCVDVWSSCLFGNAVSDVSVFRYLNRSTENMVHFRPGNLRTDPKLATDLQLTSGSRCIGRGEDVSAGGVVMPTDVWGRPWNGTYDMGAFKSASAIVKGTKYDEVYVSPDGDDDNEGNVASAPVKTVQEGLLRTAPGGTCHVAAGTYVESVQIDAAGATLVGAGAGSTVLTGSETGNDVLIAVMANDVKIMGLTIRNARTGIDLGHDDYARSTVVEDCVIEGCWHGAEKAIGCFPVPPASTPFPADYPQCRFSRVVFRDNLAAAGYFYCLFSGVVLDSCLVSGNTHTSSADDASAASGIYGYKMRIYSYNTTFLGNQGYALYTQGDWHLVGYAYNSLFAGNGCGWRVTGNSYGTGHHNIFDNPNGRNYELGDGNSKWRDADLTTFFVTDARIETSGKYAGRPLENSPARGGGVNINGTDAAKVEVTKDLLGNPYRPRHWDIGCYAQPLPGLMLLVK